MKEITDTNHRLRMTDFPDLSRTFEQQAKPMLAGTAKMKNCYITTGNYLQVRVFFGKRTHTILNTAWINVVKALRVADAAVLYFWKYRKTARKPCDLDFNFSMQSAQSDFDTIPFIKELFTTFELELDLRGELPAVRDRAKKLELQPARVAMMQHWSEFTECFRLMFFQCPVTAKTKINFDIAKERIEELEKIMITVNSVAEQAGVSNPEVQTATPEQLTAKPDTNDVVIGPDGAAQPALHSIDHSVIPPLFSK